MYKKVKGGKKVDIQGVECWIPPVGYVVDSKGKLREVGIVSRSEDKLEQFWEREQLPDDWTARELAEKRIIENQNPDYFDPILEELRIKFWDRRLNGMWFMNKGVPTYITGLHYFYLQWWYQAFDTIDGYPAYWDSDREFFYFTDSNIKNPNCIGQVYCTKRREGKTGKSGAFIYEGPSRLKKRNGGIQSKTETDAKITVFKEALMTGFSHLPKFFRPVYDNQGKDNFIPKTRLEFIDPKGEVRGLGGWIEWRSSKETAFDSTKLWAYVGDEIFKTDNVDVRDRHNIVAYCARDTNGKPWGFLFYTSTVEEMHGDIGVYRKFWEDSDQRTKDPILKRTKTGLHQYFLSADKARNRDKYGQCDIEKNRKEILAEREMFKNDIREYNSLIRKEPLSIEEAFRVSGTDSIYDAASLNERLDYLSYQENLYDRGDFVWKDGERDGEVIFKKNRSGRFKVRYLFEDKEDANNVLWKGSTPTPQNNRKFTIGIDPYDHKTTVDNRRSDAAAYVLAKYNIVEPHISNSFIVEYIGRPQSPSIFYEDMIKVCHYYGCSMLFEDNKQGIMTYFEERGYHKFLMKLPGRKGPGIPGSTKTHQLLAEITEEYIHNDLDKVYFKNLITDWIKFEINNTTKYDAAMAAGYTLIADSLIKFKDKSTKVYESSELFRKKKIGRSRLLS